MQLCQWKSLSTSSNYKFFDKQLLHMDIDMGSSVKFKQNSNMQFQAKLDPLNRAYRSLIKSLCKLWYVPNENQAYRFTPQHVHK